jgi:hypothetical protein
MAKTKHKKNQQVDWVRLAVPHLLAVTAAVVIAGTVTIAYALAN